MTTAKIKLTPFQALIASGSGISDPSIDSGYQLALVQEVHRVMPSGGTISADAEGLRDLAEWAGDLGGAVAQEPNPAGAASLYKLSQRAYDLARELEREASA